MCWVSASCTCHSYTIAPRGLRGTHEWLSCVKGRYVEGMCMLRCMYLPEHFRVTDHIHVCTCTLCNPHVLYTVHVHVKDSPQNCSCTCTRDMREYPLRSHSGPGRDCMVHPTMDQRLIPYPVLTDYCQLTNRNVLLLFLLPHL